MNSTILQLGDTILQLRDTNEELCAMVDCNHPKAYQLCPVTCKDGMFRSMFIKRAKQFSFQPKVFRDLYQSYKHQHTIIDLILCERALLKDMQLTASTTRSAVFNTSSAFVAILKRPTASDINFSPAVGSSLNFFLATRLILSFMRACDQRKTAMYVSQQEIMAFSTSNIQKQEDK